MGRSLGIALAILAVAVVLTTGPSLLVSPNADEVAPAEEPTPEIVTVDGSDSGFWPYLNAKETHQNRSPLNVIVRGDPEQILTSLAEHGEGDWDEAEHDHFNSGTLFEGNATNTTMDPATEADATTNTTLEEYQPLSPTAIPWSQADGTTRYAYVDPGPGDDPYWMTETLQLEDGDYYGERDHVRLYESPNPADQWVVMQAHSEHFDWFTLRHRVDGVEAAQSRLEADLMAIPGVDQREDIQRTYLGNDGPADADGWASKVDLTAMALAPVVLGLAARRRHSSRDTSQRPPIGDRGRRAIESRLTATDRARLTAVAGRLEVGHLLLAGSIIGIVLGVRLAGIALDRYSPLSVHGIAALLYPAIALGLPIVTYAIASRLERRLETGAIAATSLAVAIWLDYGFIGVDTLPLDVVVQRTLVVLALGLVAAGAVGPTRDRRLSDVLVVGLGLWVVVLGATLVGYL